MIVEQPIEKLKKWLTPFIPLRLIFGKRKEALTLLDQLTQQIDDLISSQNILQKQISEVDQALSESNALIVGTQHQLLKQKEDQLLALESLNSSKKILEEQLNSLEQILLERNNEITDLKSQTVTLKNTITEDKLRQTLIARLLSAPNFNQGVKDYFQLLEHDFLEFTNQEDSLEEEAAAILELQAIGEELKVVGAYPEFYKKRSLAIAGGFSAGKSEFISSLFEDASVRLPIGIEPTTAIPTYTLNGEENGVIGCNNNGGVIDLFEIDPDFQHKLSHTFIRSFGFNLKSIMPFVFVTTPMAFKHLCFIDTPGYNPSDVAEGHTSEDIKTAEEFVQNAEALLWLIGLDSNGTISKSDLDFLEYIGQHSHKPLYIVLNKADLRPFDQLEDIVEEVADTLNDYDIEIVGISAYSSITKEEFIFYKKSLHAFLTELDVPSKKYDLILQRLYAVDEKYQRAILRDIKENKQIGIILSGLKLDLLQNGFDDISSELYEKINRMSALFIVRQKEEHLKQLESVMNKMTKAVACVFGQEVTIKRKTWTLDEIELDEKFVQLMRKEQLPEELEDNKGERADLGNGKFLSNCPTLTKQGLKNKFWARWANVSIGDDVQQGLNKLLLEEKEEFTEEEWKKITGLTLKTLQEIETNDMVHQVFVPVSKQRFWAVVQPKIYRITLL